ncbi:MAG: metalloregulator ArsR/SmtB family transcription factor [Pseudodesulfovibrio sp.]|uniref:Regulatory protein ArsR n=1 Tax=Pseudodesulfovibrio aespoeensis (strain ATCC 700646 / DSM 10631 / Aspo-2) TaxID=643562 RepID=E6VU65_PSEA9|nr:MULTISPECIES: metalloregulator ArsR/SmtB family transcription factor [Pseudodesulfovibrio]MBU4193277.1 metalloregulator ArsR/SmtB family transcription factor [Pseudomonadota bacterium]ADU62258.1 regulatory protein ArsR [Pseudodesulfovibrio aespoeensis Aspo-2]MBU4243308.1 metalloregulator ArsR/SmtB family transcription factor [Pseudomonadota bacterium]MBU4380369.1 metalloregulator ArsR/SmtB family transcription factor [Pseudomonadota bacterium]MBU4476620.1 metalloregulator ArsR/SmtB family t
MSNIACGNTEQHVENVDRVRGQMLTERDFLFLAELFKALGDYTRVRMLYALSINELCVCALAEVLDMSPSAISHQLRLLRAARLVRYRKDGKNVYYTLDDDHVRALIVQGLDHVREEG